MATLGPYSPGTCADDSAVGTLTWANVNNAKASDNTYTSASGDVAHGALYTHYLKATNFGFAVPTGKRIDGITVEVEKKYGNSAYEINVSDYRARVIKSDGSIGSTSRAAGYWSLSEAYVTYGGAADLWGETWTAEDINDADFGFAIAATLNGTEDNWDAAAYIDHIRITVTYSDPAPTAPTGLTRTNFDAADAAVFVWTYNHVTSLAQSAYQLLIYDASDSSLDYDSGKVSSGTAALNLTAATLANGKQYQWKVRTYDSLDQVSAYSDLATFYTSAKPVGAITFPAVDEDEIATATLTATATYTDAGAQSASRFELLDSLGGTLEDSGKVDGTDVSYLFDYTLVNTTDYAVRVTFWDDKDVASTPVTRTFTVSFAGPAQPTVVITSDNARGSITLTITNPAAEEGDDTLDYNSVYRKKSTESAYIRIATAIASGGAYTDYTPASGATYSYFVRAVGESTGYTDSAAGNKGITIKHSQLALVSDYNQYVDLVYSPNRKVAPKYERTLTKFAGRSSSVAEFGEHVDVDLPLSFELTDPSALTGILDQCQIMLYRDGRGRREFVTAGAASIDDQFTGLAYKVSIPLNRTAFVEVV